MYSGGLLIAGVFDVVIPAKIFDCNKMLSGLYVGPIERQADNGRGFRYALRCESHSVPLTPDVLRI